MLCRERVKTWLYSGILFVQSKKNNQSPCFYGVSKNKNKNKYVTYVIYLHGSLNRALPDAIASRISLKTRTSRYKHVHSSYLKGSFPLRGENVGVVSRLFAVDALYQKEFPEMAF
jgi:hypothetical protein